MDIADSAEYKELSDNQKQLQKIGMGFGLSYRGSKHELKLKILKYKENSTDPNVNLKEVARKKYMSMVVPDIKAELMKRKLVFSKYIQI